MAKIKLLDFYADWCQPCKQMVPILEEFEKENPEVEVVKIDSDKDKKAVEKYGIMSIPTYVVEVDGKEKTRGVGQISGKKLVEMIS